jgi:hypothetical protein
MSRFNQDSTTVFNLHIITLTNPNTEYSVDIGKAVRKISIQCRESVDIKFAMKAGDIAAGNYQTIKAGAEKFLDNIYLVDQTTLYFETTDTGSPTVEVEVWK